MTFRTFHLIMLFGALCSSACGGDRNPSNISNGPGGFVNPDTWDVSFGSSDGSSPATDSAPQDSSPDLSSGTADTLQDFDDSGHSDTTHEPDVAEHLDGSSSMDTVATLSAAPDGALGAHLDESTLTVRVFSAHATRMELWLYQDPTGEARWARALTRSGDIWSGVAPLSEIREVLGEGTIYYGYRAWGPNWPWVAEWTPGSVEGFLTDVDAFGNRFNPNKLALDPYAREVSHDPWTPSHHDGRTYASGEHRAVDSGPVAPKGIVLPMPEAAPERVAAPERAFRDEVIYEVHLRGLTRNDPSVPEAWRGTYRGAAERAAWLRSLGVTAIELLPLHDTPNDRNDVEEGADGDNYWGYSSLSYFAPDRRYAADTRPGGPTREFKAMVDAFHAEGLKVYVDVVYNHTAEGGTWDASGQTAMLLSWRALDNATYYQVHDAGRRYQNNNGVGPNVGVRHPATQTMILDSLRYWHRVLGVDGFRFDLAPILGNDCHGGCFRYNNTDSLLTAIADLARPADGGPGVDLIAEPWGIGEGTYQMGNFPLGWAEWNDRYRDTVRDAQNRWGLAFTTPGGLAMRLQGSPDLFQDDGRKPWHSVNFVVAHDGLTLHDLYACNGKNNQQPWPYGPSDGGTDQDRAWDQGGDPVAQRQAARTGLALLLLSAGVPMITGGDEHLRTLRCNNNPYNLDSTANWLNWARLTEQAAFVQFTRALLQFRARHPALRPAHFHEGRDTDGDNVLDLAWLTPDGRRADGDAMADPDAHLLTWRLDTDEHEPDHTPVASILIVYNRGPDRLRAHLPAPRADHGWFRTIDTASWFEEASNVHSEGEEQPIPGEHYDLAPRSLIVLVELPDAG